MRNEIRLADAADLKSFGGGKVDLGELDAITAQLEQLGFRELGTLLGKVIFDPPPPPAPSPIVDPTQERATLLEQEIIKSLDVETDTTTFARIFAHPGYGCYANVISSIAIARFDPSLHRADIIKIKPFRITIMSLENTGENSWSFANGNREVDRFLLLLRHPRKLAHRMVGATPQQLLQAHLAERDDIAKRGDFHWDKEPSMEKYRAMERSTIDYIYRVTQQWKPFPVAFHLLTYKYKNHDWWLGELEDFPK
jgi:hypothetical protein